MQYDLEKHGDSFEKNVFGFIREKIPAYEENWKLYIGHRGKGRMAEITGLSEVEEKERVNFSQHHYTILESIYLMHLISKDDIFNSPVLSFWVYSEINIKIIAYHALAGRLKDNFSNCFELMLKKSTNESKAEIAKNYCGVLDALYERRNLFLHSIKVPMSFDEHNLIQYPEIQTTSNQHDSFGNKSNWYDSQFKLRYISDELKKYQIEVETASNDLLYKLTDELNQFKKDKLFQLLFSFETIFDTKNIPVAYISGSMGHQGVDFNL
ncbi:MAG: hypothetical protein IPK88_00575 [Saprospiraceae bacterium]|nr:hypothetical protein [Candidatus Defluviibacterium haderslevense]